jgi:hypothetical protein
LILTGDIEAENMLAANTKCTRVIHAAKRECGLDDSLYRALLEGAAGVPSASQIRTYVQFNAVMTAFKKLGFRVTSKAGGDGTLKETDRDTKQNRKWITAKQEYSGPAGFGKPREGREIAGQDGQAHRRRGQYPVSDAACRAESDTPTARYSG